MRLFVIGLIWIVHQLPIAVLGQDGQDIVSTRIDPSGNPFFDLSTSKAKVNVTCGSSEMLAEFSFVESFWGHLMLDFESNDPDKRYCSVVGNGSQELTLRIPLYGCGTKKASNYTFKNVVTVLFDQSQVLEQGDQRKTILCAYPVPVAPAFIEIRRDMDESVLNSAGIQWTTSSNAAKLVLLLCFLFTVR